MPAPGATSTRARIRLLLWIALILFLVTPWWSFQWHSHWGNVRWLPFVSSPLRIRDLLLNVLLYVPLGYWGLKSGSGSVRRTIMFAFVLSTATELLQVFSHGRVPSTTDIATNVIGAYCGAIWAGRRVRQLHTSSHPLRQTSGERLVDTMRDERRA